MKSAEEIKNRIEEIQIEQAELEKERMRLKHEIKGGTISLKRREGVPDLDPRRLRWKKQMNKKDLLKESKKLMERMLSGNLPEEYKDSINGITRTQYVLDPGKYKYKIMFSRNQKMESVEEFKTKEITHAQKR